MEQLLLGGTELAVAGHLVLFVAARALVGAPTEVLRRLIELEQHAVDLLDLVLPDVAYLRERADDIEAIVLTHGHEDHVGALPFVVRSLGRSPTVYGGPLTAAMVRSKLDEHRLKDVPVEQIRAAAWSARNVLRNRRGRPVPDYRLVPRHANA